MQHIRFLERAVELATLHMEAGDGGPFGAVIVRDGQIIAEGWNCVTSKNDPTAHAEVTAIRNACATLGNFQLEGCTIYSSCEPCPMCLGAMYWARPDALYYAATRADAAEAGFDDAFIYEELPKDPSDRSFPCIHLAEVDASVSFSAWKRKNTKIAY